LSAYSFFRSSFTAGGTPLFPRAEIDLGGSSPFVIDAPGASAQTPYITAAHLDGQPLTGTWLPGSAVKAGGSLQLTMSPTAGTWGAAADDHPPSLSTAGLAPFGCGDATGPAPDVPELPNAPIALLAGGLMLALMTVRRTRSRLPSPRG
jgi:hypothetical protein